MGIFGCPFVKDQNALENYVGSTTPGAPTMAICPADLPVVEAVKILLDWHSGKPSGSDPKDWTVSLKAGDHPRRITLRGYAQAVSVLAGLLQKSARKDASDQISVECSCRDRR